LGDRVGALAPKFFYTFPQNAKIGDGGGTHCLLDLNVG